MGPVTAEELTDLCEPIRRLAREHVATQAAAVRESGRGAALHRAGWTQLAEIGVLGALAPAQRGGVELDLGTVAALIEECGHGLIPGPLVWSCLAATVLDGVAEGERIVTGALSSGGPILLEHGDAADDVLIVDDEIARFAAADLQARPVQSIDPLTSLARVSPPTKGGTEIGDADLAREWFRTGACLSAAYLVGLARRALELGVEHARNRVQFGRPIGGFQAVKHLLADIVVAVEPAAAAVADAAGRLQAGDSDAAITRACAAAKVLAGEAAERGAKNCIQVHGGMGYAWESEPHLVWKRAMIYGRAFGTADEHARALAETLNGAHA